MNDFLKIFLCTVILALFFALFLHYDTVKLRGDNVYRRIAHANPDTGANRIWGGYTNDTKDTGSCNNCHIQHAEYDGNLLNAGAGEVKLLFDVLNIDDANAVCYECHTGTSTVTPAWPGKTIYNLSSHMTGANVIWPGATDPITSPSKVALNAGHCVNCHNPHGRRIGEITGGDGFSAGDGGGYQSDSPTPDMTVRLEEYLCLVCHDADGPAAVDNRVGDQFTTAPMSTNASPDYWSHPIRRDAANDDRTPYYHTTPEVDTNFANRHVECADCHNPHYAQAGNHTPGDTKAGAVILGSKGVRVTGVWPTQAVGGAGTNLLPAQPTFENIRITSTATNYEYQLCFRCHAAAPLPAYAAPDDVTDVSMEFNPQNLSHHAVIAPGNLQSANLSDAAFVSPWRRMSFVTCTDCHMTNTAPYTPKGPHGSGNQYLLTDTTIAGATHDVFCHKCHNWNTYDWSGGARALARLTHPPGGTAHDDIADVPFTGVFCMNCHGGGAEGGLHGTNAGFGNGAGGDTQLGLHFMNGAVINGFTYDNGAMDQSECFNKAATDAYTTGTGCTQHSAGTGGEDQNYFY